jgi:hypothetical protein
VATLSFEESKLKEIFKLALGEILEERHDLFVEVVEEALEDIALLNAMQEGELSGGISREDVFSLLEKS